MLFRAIEKESQEFIKGYPFKTKSGQWYMHPVDDVFSYVEIDGDSLSMTIEDEFEDSEKQPIFARVFKDGYGGDVVTGNAGDETEACIDYESHSFHCCYNFWTLTGEIKMGLNK